MICLLQHKLIKNGDLDITYFDGIKLELNPVMPHYFYKKVYDEKVISTFTRRLYKSIPTLEKITVGNFEWRKK